jgi:hypothetical protein
MEEYKKKVKENATIFVVIKRDHQRAGFFAGHSVRTRDPTIRNSLTLGRTTTGTMPRCVSPIGEFCHVWKGDDALRKCSLRNVCPRESVE